MRLFIRPVCQTPPQLDNTGKALISDEQMTGYGLRDRVYAEFGQDVLDVVAYSSVAYIQFFCDGVTALILREKLKDFVLPSGEPEAL